MFSYNISILKSDSFSLNWYRSIVFVRQAVTIITEPGLLGKIMLKLIFANLQNTIVLGPIYCL